MWNFFILVYEEIVEIYVVLCWVGVCGNLFVIDWFCWVVYFLSDYWLYFVVLVWSFFGGGGCDICGCDCVLSGIWNFFRFVWYVDG